MKSTLDNLEIITKKYEVNLFEAIWYLLLILKHDLELWWTIQESSWNAATSHRHINIAAGTLPWFFLPRGLWGESYSDVNLLEIKFELRVHKGLLINYVRENRGERGPKIPPIALRYLVIALT